MKECKLKNCERTHYALGYCRPHYERKRRNGSVGYKVILVSNKALKFGNPLKCNVKTCFYTVYGNGLCHKHYQYMRWATKSEDTGLECAVPGCLYSHHAKGYCKFHYDVSICEKEAAKIKTII